MNAFQAKGAMALFTIKVGMEVVYFTITVIAANGIFQRARTVVYGMDEMVDLSTVSKSFSKSNKEKASLCCIIVLRIKSRMAVGFISRSANFFKYSFSSIIVFLLMKQR